LYPRHLTYSTNRPRQNYHPEQRQQYNPISDFEK
jgi:hypothetical protein